MFWQSAPAARCARAACRSTARSRLRSERSRTRRTARAAGVPRCRSRRAGSADHGCGVPRGTRVARGARHPVRRRAPRRPDRSGRSAAAELGYPVVLKALGILHKSDAGGVALDLADDAAVAPRRSDMQERLGPDGFAVEPMSSSAAGVELIVGCRRDPRFGPLAPRRPRRRSTPSCSRRRRHARARDADELERLLRSLRGAGCSPVPAAARRSTSGRRRGRGRAVTRCGGPPGDRGDRGKPAARPARRRVVGLDAASCSRCVTPSRGRAPRRASAARGR